MSKTTEVPICSECGKAMIWSFALSGCEYVCPKCLIGVGMFNGNPKVTITQAWHNRKKRNYKYKLHKIALTYGGGECANCGNDRSCKTCKIAFSPTPDREEA